MTSLYVMSTYIRCPLLFTLLSGIWCLNQVFQSISLKLTSGNKSKHALYTRSCKNSHVRTASRLTSPIKTHQHTSYPNEISRCMNEDGTLLRAKKKGRFGILVQYTLIVILDFTRKFQLIIHGLPLVLYRCGDR